jgi:hypothetical protein
MGWTWLVVLGALVVDWGAVIGGLAELTGEMLGTLLHALVPFGVGVTAVLLYLAWERVAGPGLPADHWWDGRAHRVQLLAVLPRRPSPTARPGAAGAGRAALSMVRRR